MKIIQSLWTTPLHTNASDDVNLRYAGGWPSSKYHAISWALSALKLKQLYEKIHLYADNEGRDWLINQLQLPYNEVHVELNELDRYHPSLWSLSKIYAYGKQDRPFLHIDGDVFMWKPLPTEKMKAILLCQNVEENFSFYSASLEEIKQHFSFLPELFKRNNGQQTLAANAGVMGGNNTTFFANYARQAFELVERNKQELNKIDVGAFNNVLEQYFLFQLARERSLHFEAIFDSIPESYMPLLQINTAPVISSFVHTVGNSKKNMMICLEMEARLKFEFPKIHAHISQLYPETKKISLGSEKIKAAWGCKYALTFYQNHFPEKSVTLSEFEQIFLSLRDEDDEHNEVERVVIDFFAIEEAFNQLYQVTVKGEFDQVRLTEIFDLLSFLYVSSSEAFLSKCYKLNSKYCRILILRHQFETALSFPYFEMLASGERHCEPSPDYIAVVEYCRTGVQLNPLLDWDMLLVYFDDEPCTGHELLKMIESGEVRIPSDPASLKQNIFNFLLSNLLVTRRLVFADYISTF
jgi:hypothetical protein